MLKPSAEVDRQSLENAVRLLAEGGIARIEVGTAEGLRLVHERLFSGLCDFAGKLRSLNLAKGGFQFANCLYLRETLAAVERMPETSFEEIVAKYVEMNVAHPFMDGNGRATRIWLDMMLRRRLGRVVDWRRVGKDDYLRAMARSVSDDHDLRLLIRANLTDDVEDREVVIIGLERSWQYESP